MFLSSKLPRNSVKKLAAISGVLFLTIVLTHDNGVPDSINACQRTKIIQWCSELESLLEIRNAAILEAAANSQDNPDGIASLAEQTERINGMLESAWSDPTFSYIDEQLKAHFGAVLIDLREFERLSNSLDQFISDNSDSGLETDNKQRANAISEALNWPANQRPNHCHLKPCFLCRSQTYFWKRLGWN